jgi:hypothetical protein
MNQHAVTLQIEPLVIVVCIAECARSGTAGSAAVMVIVANAPMRRLALSASRQSHENIHSLQGKRWQFQMRLERTGVSRDFAAAAATFRRPNRFCLHEG